MTPGTLKNYVRGALDPQQCQELETHLESCECCQALVQSMYETVQQDRWLVRLRNVAPSLDSEKSLSFLKRLEVNRPRGTKQEMELPGPHSDEFIGTLGKYRIREKIGEGTFAVVYLGEHADIGKRVAIRVLKPERYLDRERRALLLHEARTNCRVTSDYVARIEDVDEADGFDFLVMELVTGNKLSDFRTPAVVQRQIHRSSGAVPVGYKRQPSRYKKNAASIRHGTPPLLSIRGVAELMVQATDGLQALHQNGVVHQDIKPGNILVQHLDTGLRVKIVDFGMIAGIGDLTKGLTEAYASPEQIQCETLRESSDIFSLGVVLYELLTGELPFAKRRMDSNQLMTLVPEDTSTEGTGDQVVCLPTLRDKNPNVSPELEAITQKCLQPDPANRYQTADLLGNDLRCWLENRPVTAMSIGRVAGWKLWTKRNPTIACIQMVLVTLIALLIAYSYHVDFKNAEISKKNHQLEISTRIAEEASARSDLHATDARVAMRTNLMTISHLGLTSNDPQIARQLLSQSLQVYRRLEDREDGLDKSREVTAERADTQFRLAHVLALMEEKDEAEKYLSAAERSFRTIQARADHTEKDLIHLVAFLNDRQLVNPLLGRQAVPTENQETLRLARALHQKSSISHISDDLLVASLVNQAGRDAKSEQYAKARDLVTEALEQLPPHDVDSNASLLRLKAQAAARTIMALVTSQLDPNSEATRSHARLAIQDWRSLLECYPNATEFIDGYGKASLILADWLSKKKEKEAAYQLAGEMIAVLDGVSDWALNTSVDAKKALTDAYGARVIFFGDLDKSDTRMSDQNANAQAAREMSRWLELVPARKDATQSVLLANYLARSGDHRRAFDLAQEYVDDAKSNYVIAFDLACVHSNCVVAAKSVVGEARSERELQEMVDRYAEAGFRYLERDYVLGKEDVQEALRDPGPDMAGLKNHDPSRFQALWK